MSKLVIVESPSKAKTIQKYLGKDYEVVASMGHVRDLPKARLSVDVKDNFKPKYSIIKGKEKLVKELKEAAAKSDGVLLATDPDREGEAISWHLAYILGLDEDAQDRVTFNEITRTGVEEGMNHPRAIDLDLVNAQQARRILDRLVGYTLSPFLAKTIRRGLSAGRVQSVAVRMIVDREEEIKAFVPQEYWTIDAKLTAPPSKAVFAAAFYGDENGEIKISSKEESDKLFAQLEQEEFYVSAVKKGKKNRSPAPPFITSTLQQEASRKLGFQARRTMKAAQELYEGVEIEGQGSIGLITYMRTDSLRISEDAIKDALGLDELRIYSGNVQNLVSFSADTNRANEATGQERRQYNVLLSRYFGRKLLLGYTTSFDGEEHNLYAGYRVAPKVHLGVSIDEDNNRWYGVQYRTRF